MRQHHSRGVALAAPDTGRVHLVATLTLATAALLAPLAVDAQTARPSAPGPRAAPQVVQPAIDLGSAFAAVAEQVTPAVVEIDVEIAPRATDPSLDVRRRGSAPREASGSGFIVSADGYILTNNHVVEGATRVSVTMLDKRVFTARVVGGDPTTDVAVIKIDATRLPTLSLGDDAKIRVGEFVLAVGNPLGLDFTVTSGIVSAKGRSVRGLIQNTYAITDFIQTDAAINPGNSGGPLVNMRGEVVGINSAIASPTGTYAGYGFAIPSSLARVVMDDLIRDGVVHRAVLGLSLNDVTAASAERLKLPRIGGALVGGFGEGPSPAADAGVQMNDVIVALNGQAVNNVTQLTRLVRNHKPGDTVVVTVVRAGAEQTVRVVLGAAPREA
jgi:serine protease Do